MLLRDQPLLPQTGTAATCPPDDGPSPLCHHALQLLVALLQLLKGQLRAAEGRQRRVRRLRQRRSLATGAGTWRGAERDGWCCPCGSRRLQLSGTPGRCDTAVRGSAVRGSAMRGSAVRRNAVRGDAVRCNAVRRCVLAAREYAAWGHATVGQDAGKGCCAAERRCGPVLLPCSWRTQAAAVAQ